MDGFGRQESIFMVVPSKNSDTETPEVDQIVEQKL